MRINSGPLALDIQMITEDKSKPTHWGYTVSVRGGGAQVNALKLESETTYADYAGSFGEEVLLTAWFVEDDVNKVILPNAKDLELIVTRRSLGSAQSGGTQSRQGYTDRYKATITDVTVPEVGESNSVSRDSKNAMKRLTFQLFDRALYELKAISVGGILRHSSAADALNVLLTAKSSALTIDDAVKPLGVTMVPADTALNAQGKPNLREHIVIKDGTQLTALARYLQQHCGGIYNNGIGCFYVRRQWYVYPLYDSSRFANCQQSLTLIRVPSETMPDVPHSYTMRGNHLFALATDEAISIDNTDHKQLNQGNGTLFATASGVMDKFVPRDDSKAMASQSDVMGRIAVEQRPDGLNNAVFGQRRISDNIAEQISGLSARNQQFMQVAWAYSDPALVYPGMPVRLLYANGNKVEAMVGTVHAIETFTELSTPGMATQHYQCKSVLTLSVTKQPENKIG
ncbi:hypothetical protein pEaSNUABM54_00013 [Erwinia phage pEa_SNUABM_54]|nr:hypothetical protein pEaSNUABM54_00013 [Erwinia phage pEa_SNUABM_54]